MARFEAERQPLAVMEHPSIARVFDAGTTDGGSLYFVMEYVEGTTFGQYCDARNLSVGKRLELFLPVCLAVQHAHQKGVIHRDLKPSNVLVTEQAGAPLPKVIDFGIAKAANPRLADHTLVTQVGTVLGAGILEDILHNHGPTVIDRVEARAAADQRFRFCLSHVWPGDLPSSLWDRVVAARGDEPQRG